MTASDHVAFLKAIAADPADLTGRLAFADFLEETGEPPQLARAEFIRTQIEADGLPPNDPRRAELLGWAGGQFAEHWIEWWTPVCRAVGLRLPHVPGTGWRERFARALGTDRPPGWPYRAGHSEVGVLSSGDGTYGRTDQLLKAWFRRGFPEGVALSGKLTSWAQPIRRFAASFPLRTLQISIVTVEDWVALAGEHLRNLEHLRVSGCRPEPVPTILASPHLGGVTALTLFPDRSRIGWGEEELRALLASPLAPRLASVTVALFTQDEAAVLAETRRLGALTGLTVRLRLGERGVDYGADEVLAILTGAPFIGRLESLTLDCSRKTLGYRPVPPAVELAIVRLLEALDPARLRFLDLDGIPATHPRIAAMSAARFGDRVGVVR
jgi:uncharacterized protein (TIGR02996 family)